MEMPSYNCFWIFKDQILETVREKYENTEIIEIDGVDVKDYKFKTPYKDKI